MIAAPTPTQRRFLTDIALGIGIHPGFAAWRARTVAALKRRGWLDDAGEITQAGLVAIAIKRAAP